MTDGYLSKDRERLNRMQRERRAQLVRIDYQPDADVLALIEARRPRYGPDATNSATLNAIVREWAEATGTKCRPFEAPTTSREAGAFRRSLHAEGSEASRILPNKPRTPCGAKRRRDGQPCQALSVPGKHRCKWHGGCSTGPKTADGKARALANLRRGSRHGEGAFLGASSAIESEQPALLKPFRPEFE